MVALLTVVVFGFAGCATDQPSPSYTDPGLAAITPYSSPTPSETPETKHVNLVTPTKLPTPTSTPVIYTIVVGDTMLAIAMQHGIGLEDLQAANPEVNARLLVIGTELVIPLGENVPSNPITATPIPINLTSENCYSAPDGIICFILVRNDRPRPMENISAQVILYGESGAIITEGVAIGAVNRLPANEELPLVVFFPGRYSTEVKALTNVLTAQPVPNNDDRYLNAWLEVDEVIISGAGLQAEVSGSIGLPAKSLPGNLAWILVVAYDNDGRVVGIRKEEQFGRFEPGSSRNFVIDVFSLDTSITEVKTFVEVRP